MGSESTGRDVSAVDGLATLSFVIHGLLERRAAEHDVSMVQARLLGVLRDRRPTINELAKLLALDKSSVSGLVDSGRSLISGVSVGFEADVATLLDRLSRSDRAALPGLVSRLLVAHAADQGVDLFATIDTEG
jgi:hypothetical protein